ncbi:MAG: glycogen/starch synthase, partial [Candidatus Uhrbacteria bacterium]
MRVAQVTPVYPPYHGGIGAVAFEYANQLADRGHQVDVLTPQYRLDGIDRRKPVNKDDKLPPSLF